MKTKALIIGLSLSTSAFAGDFLTNTNQTIDYLRNPARDAAISLDGVYSNPAGVAFLPQGVHVGFNWQYAHQTRTVTNTSPSFALGRKNGGNTVKQFEGTSDAPFIPSLQIAWNKGNWAHQFNASVTGGGGACEFSDGLGSFESVVGNIAPQLVPLGASGYDMNSYMKGRQYYFGFQLGTAYKINEHLSIYGGLRLLYGTATYKAKISNIQVKLADDGTYVDFGSFLSLSTGTIDAGLTQVYDGLEQVQAGMAQMEAAGATALPQYAELQAKNAELMATKTKLEESRGSLDALQKYSQGVNLLCNQSSLGLAPIVGLDYRVGRWNFAAKYEFKTQIRMKNESTLNEASEIAVVNKYRDGEKVNEDMPALLTLGAQWNFIDPVRLNLGFHYYFDKAADWYDNSQELLDHNTYELLAGVEWDINDRLTISLGAQTTRYGLTDQYMNDISFVVNSYSTGFGANYKLNDVLTLKAGYFSTHYENYDRVISKEPLISDRFTRTSRVLGIGCDINL